MHSPSRAAETRIASRRSVVRPDINLVGLLSISLSLLIFFMLVPPRPRGIRPNLPYAATATLQPGAVREDAMQITILRDGQVYFRDVQIAPGELPSLIRDALRAGARKEVYLAVDSRARTGDVRPVIDQLRLGGLASVVILVNRPGNAVEQAPTR